jgi:hypothetical protein
MAELAPPLLAAAEDIGSAASASQFFASLLKDTEDT